MRTQKLQIKWQKRDKFNANHVFVGGLKTITEWQGKEVIQFVSVFYQKLSKDEFEVTLVAGWDMLKNLLKMGAYQSVVVGTEEGGFKVKIKKDSIDVPTRFQFYGILNYILNNYFKGNGSLITYLYERKNNNMSYQKNKQENNVEVKTYW